MFPTFVSRKRKISPATFFRLSFCLLAFTAGDVRADLNPKQARKSITRMPGFELTNGSVRVKSITMVSAATADAAAEIKTVFKLQKSAEGDWQVAEIRTGPDRWEAIEFISRALGTPSLKSGNNVCTAFDPPSKGSSGALPTLKRTRCLLGTLLGVEVPSDAIRIQQVSPLEIPLGTQPSATVVGWVRVDARLVNDRKGWQVTELRTGKNDWAKLAEIVASVNGMKETRARAELALITKALESFRRDTGFYIVSDQHAKVIDHLSPHYLPQIIRVDPWHQPYKYLGDRDHFTLRSAGPDAKENTADDILVNQLPYLASELTF